MPIDTQNQMAIQLQAIQQQVNKPVAPAAPSVPDLSPDVNLLKQQVAALQAQLQSIHQISGPVYRYSLNVLILCL